MIALVALFFAGTAAAGAHAVLMSTDPRAGALVDTAPATVRLHFGEAVETSLGRIQILDDAGADHALGKPFHPGGDTSWVAVQSRPLVRGRYTVSWQVVSADSHVVNGAFAFGVGVAAGNVPAALADKTNPGAAAVQAVLRFFGLSSLLIGAGLAFALAIVVRPRETMRTTMLEFGAWIVVAVVACADIVAHAVSDSCTVAAVLATQFGLLRVVLVVAAILAVVAVAGRRRRAGLLGVAAAVAIVSESLSGHAASGRIPGIGIAADVTHLIAAAAWIGALIATLIAADIVDVRRVSTVATAAIALLAASAVVQTVRNAGSFAALVHTTYGLLICAKIVLFVVAVAFALISRRRLRDGAVALARSVRLELAVLTAVIAVTGVLVDGVPPRTAIAASLRTVHAQFLVRDTTVAVEAEPAGSGRWQLRVAANRGGAPVTVDEISASLREASRAVGPLAFPLQHSGIGRYTGVVTVPFAGRWTATVRVRVGDFDEGTTFVNLEPQ